MDKISLKECRLYIRSLLLISIGVILLCFYSQCLAEESSDVVRWSKIRAAFLYYSMKFVEWPASTFSETEAPIGVCLIGDPVLKRYADEVLRGKKVKSRDVELKAYSSSKEFEMPELDSCNVIFFGEKITNSSKPLLENLNRKPVLTVGEHLDFTLGGGMIRIFQVSNNIRFDVNLKKLRTAGLKMSSEMLQLAETVAGLE